MVLACTTWLILTHLWLAGPVYPVIAASGPHFFSIQWPSDWSRSDRIGSNVPASNSSRMQVWLSRLRCQKVNLCFLLYVYSMSSFDSRGLVGKASIRPCQSPRACLTLPNDFENECGVSIACGKPRDIMTVCLIWAVQSWLMLTLDLGASFPRACWDACLL